MRDISVIEVFCFLIISQRTPPPVT